MHRRGNKWFAMNVTQVGEDVSLHLKDGFFWASVPAESLDSGVRWIRAFESRGVEAVRSHLVLSCFLCTLWN